LTRKQVVKKLDAEFSKFIRNRDKRCVLCGTTENLQCGHLLTRVAYSTRWDEVNCHCQCRSHNLEHEYRPHVFTQWFLRKFGQTRYDLLIFKHNTTAKLSTNDLLALWTHYKQKNGRKP